MRIVRLIGWTCLLFMAMATPGTLHAQQPTPEERVDQLWIDVGLRPQLVEDFNKMARPQDIARADHPSMIEVLDEVEVGRRLVVFKSVVDAEQLLPHVADRFDIIGYNLEHGPSNRPDEQADPVGSVIRMRELADQYGKKVAMGPDRSFAVTDSVAMAPYVDMMILQVQRVQTQPTTVRDFVEPLAAQYRRVNPDIEVSIQIRTEGNVEQLYDLIASMSDTLDGVSILTSDETVPVGMDLLEEFRPNGSAPAVKATASGVLPPKTTPDITPPAEVPTIEPAAAELTPPSSSQASLTGPEDETASTDLPAQNETSQNGEEPDWLLMAGIFTIGVIGSGLIIASIVFAVQNSNSG
jgi:hypothetical protein